MKPFILPAIAVALIAFAACKGKTTTPDLDLGNQTYTDNGIDPTGSVGDQSKNTSYEQETWDAGVKALFSPLDTAVLPVAGNGAPAIQYAVAYPNPAHSMQTVAWLNSGDPVNFKAVLVNRRREALARYSANVSTSACALDYQHLNLGGDSLFRLYFAFSVADHPYYITEHVDVTIK